MDCKVVWTDPAIHELRDAVAYIAQDDPAAARVVGEDIIKTVELLQKFPLIGPVYSRSGGRVREVLCWNHRIFYRVTSEKRLVEILTIWHGARDEPSNLGQQDD